MRPRALIFDDDPMIRQMLWSIFDRRGYEVLTFPDPGLCPLHLKCGCTCGAETACTDLILSDLEMPCVKGLDFVEALVRKGCHCRHIALMSGAWSRHDIARASGLGCKLFAKPFHLSEILDWLAEVEGTLAPDRKLQEWQALRNTPEA